MNRAFTTLVRIATWVALGVWMFATVQLLDVNVNLVKKISLAENHRPVVLGAVDFMTGDVLIMVDGRTYGYPQFCSSEF